MVLRYIKLKVDKWLKIIAGMGNSTLYFTYLYIFSYCSFLYMSYLLCQIVSRYSTWHIVLAKLMYEASTSFYSPLRICVCVCSRSHLLANDWWGMMISRKVNRNKYRWKQNKTYLKEDGNKPQVTVNYYCWLLVDIPWQPKEEGSRLNPSVAFNLPQS